MPTMQSSDTVELFGAYVLSPKLAVSQSCLGKRLRVKVGNLAGTLSLPVLKWQDDQPVLTAPAMAPALAERVARSVEGDTWHYWGECSAWHPLKRTIDGAFVGALWLEFSTTSDKVTYSESLHGRGQPEGEPLKQLFYGVNGWSEAISTWTEILADQDLVGDGQLRSGWTPGEGLALLTRDAEGLSLPAYSNEMHVFLREVEELTLAKLRRVVRAANEGIQPSDAQLLIRDARRELRRGRHRRAVIDAGTALELTLASFNAAVTNVRPKKGQFPTLGWYVKRTKIASAAGLPSTVYKDLVEPRNQAVHANRIPTPAAAQVAVNLARGIVDHLDPPAV